MRYFTINELTRSDTARKYGVDNRPGSKETAALERLVDNVLDPLREMYGKPVRVTSGYRCPKLNRLVGGVVNSHHTYGYAADIVGFDRSKDETRKLFVLLRDGGFRFTQLIWEHNRSGSYWVHVSYIEDNLKCQVISNLLKK